MMGLEKRYLQPFSAEDPFNPGNFLDGFLSLKPSSLYGALFILRVNGWSCQQLVRATPKLHYPFGRDGLFRFPPVHDVHVYEKLDGSNILSYEYLGEGGSRFISHKLRLAPFVRNGKWGDFLDMWKEVLETRGQLLDLVRETGCNISSELYGSQNEHLIKYNNRLNSAVLFGVNRDSGKVFAPFSLNLGDLSSPRLLAKIDHKTDLVEEFSRIRSKMERGNTREDDGKISGTEGCVWYLRTPSGEVSMCKCKPESVEEIHWSTGINKASVIATCWNALETMDSISYGAIEPLLLEEYQPDDVAKFRAHIDDCIREVEEDRQFKLQVKEAYGECLKKGLDIKNDKGLVMRELSLHFPKERMSKVYGAISK